MNTAKKLSIRLEAVGGDKVRQEFKNIGSDGQKAFQRITQVITPANDNLKVLDNTAKAFNNTLKQAASLAGAYLGLRGLTNTFKSIVETNKEFERLSGSLKTVTGSAKAAKEAFTLIEDFATSTPFQLDEIVDSFIRLKAMGLEPSMEALTSYGNTASAFGKNILEFVSAVTSATVGEFERLKTFGIKAKVEGERVRFIFQGVTTEVGKNAAEIENYLRSIGTINFGGAMAEQMNTMGGTMSNIEDTLAKVARTIGENGLNKAIKEVLNQFNNLVSGTDSAAKTIGETLASAVTIAGITLNWHIPASDSEVKEIQSMRYIWRCHKCGASGTSTSLCDVKCDVCGSEIDTRDMQKYIQPAGFSVDFNAAVNNNVSVQRYINICEPLVTAHNTLNSYLGLPYVKYKNDKEGSVIHYSNGGGEGYILCLECGRMVANNKKNREEFKKRHYRLRSGVYPNSQTGNTYKVECQHSPYSIIENINLGVEIKTDLLELILSDLDGNVIDDRTLAYSLAVAIRSGIAKYMNVETEEIGCIAKQIRVNGTNKKGFAIELFDKNASGYCSSNDIIKNLNIIFKYAQNILKCDCAQSCNKCILQNDTKYNYRYLDRKLALEFLTDEWIAKNTLPQDMKIFGDGTLVASASIESLIEDTPNLQKLYLIIPENMENEDFSNSPIYRLVNRYNALNTQIILCVNEKTLGDDVKKTISLLSNLSNVSVKAIPEKLNDKIMAIVWDGFKYYSYASFDENVRQLNQYWGSNINTSILSGYIDINGLKFNDVKLETVENISYDKMFNISSEVNGPGYGFGNRLLSILASSLDKGISSPIVKIEYKDRYLKNPLASGLFYSFIKELKVRYEKLWNCASITLETAETTETNKQYPTMFYHDWDDVDARNEVLTALFDKIGLKFQLKEKNKKYLEHNRIMTIELENGEKINLILDQGFSYWRCLAYCYAENIFPFDADIDEQVAKIGQWLPNVSGDTYPTRIFYTKSK